MIITRAISHPRPRGRRAAGIAALTLAPVALAVAQTVATPPAPADSAAPSSSPLVAQSSSNDAAGGSQTITITGRIARTRPADIAGFGDVPLSKLPLSATVISQSQLADAGISGFGDLTRIEADINDAYNPPGYWSQLAIRGYTLDNRFNYRRDGLPINAETAILNANKQALEVLKGTSGLQAGTSAPGGLVNFVVKRPAGRVRSASLELEQRGTVEAAVDIGDVFGGSDAGGDGIGWRINASGARLDPQIHDARGHRWLAAGALDVPLGARQRLEFEVEASRQSQPSVPGMSLLGSRLPAADEISPRLNLNNQPWSLPVVLGGQTGSVRYTARLIGSGALGETPSASAGSGADTAGFERVDLVVHAMAQRLQTEDRIAFPFGCSAENNYSAYCSDGSYDLYDYRSEGERRATNAADVSIVGDARWGGVRHHLRAGVLVSRYTQRTQGQAYNWVGTGSVWEQPAVPADPTIGDRTTNRTERSTEFHLQDHIEVNERVGLWAGLRHTRLDRASVRNDGTEATSYQQSLTTPWLAASYAIDSATMVYASWGEGVESNVVPGKTRYTNAGQALPALKSRQIEVGVKHAGADWDWRVAAFDIRRPAVSDFDAGGGVMAAGDCGSSAVCEQRVDGIARHRGIEAEAEVRSGPWSLRGSAMALQARRRGSALVSVEGQRPTNVPDFSIKLQGAYNVSCVPGLALLAFVTHEGGRAVLPDNSIIAPSWTRIDLGLRYSQRLESDQRIVWRVGLENALNERAWQETPYQYSHAYLYPMAPRTLRASAQWSF